MPVGEHKEMSPVVTRHRRCDVRQYGDKDLMRNNGVVVTASSRGRRQPAACHVFTPVTPPAAAVLPSPKTRMPSRQRQPAHDSRNSEGGRREKKKVADHTPLQCVKAARGGTSVQMCRLIAATTLSSLTEPQPNRHPQTTSSNPDGVSRSVV
ncbi:hypothetical protein NPIL_264441 [Nephila pilipes]|uniref:Uncharacterized protein n=1 Tax=Nephila pilipes TaxID=299642 RepID=A0A8X6Q1K4_NEPPI|nr:hypothetical protein NPIL_264441 [Nephila pilipes]